MKVKVDLTYPCGAKDSFVQTYFLGNSFSSRNPGKCPVHGYKGYNCFPRQ